MKIEESEKFEPIIFVDSIEYQVEEINRGKIWLVDGRKLPWNFFFKTDGAFKEFLRNF